MGDEAPPKPPDPPDGDCSMDVSYNIERKRNYNAIELSQSDRILEPREKRVLQDTNTSSEPHNPLLYKHPALDETHTSTFQTYKDTQTQPRALPKRLIMKMVPQQYCLRWKHHHSNVQNMFAQLLAKERFCDVTLYCSPSFATQVPDKDLVDPDSIRGVSLRAHRVVLAACSELLGALLGAHEAQGEPVLVIDGAEPKHLKALLDYMYTGEMNVHHSQLASLLKTAEELRIKGLTDIRWNNKDEPPDTESLTTTTTTATDKPPHKPLECSLKPDSKKPDRKPEWPDRKSTTPEKEIKDESDVEVKTEKFSVNGGPPPLIKLPTKEKTSPPKRELSDTESPSPKRQRMTSINENSEDDDRDQEWQHGNLDITAERVVGWGDGEAAGGWGVSDDEWADAPADIGSFLHTRLRVDGDNSADEESNEGAPASTSSSAGTSAIDLPNMQAKGFATLTPKQLLTETTGPKSGPTDPRFTDVVKLNDYLRHGRRPQFWEENYVKRVMEAVRVKELEMKQAAEILGVSYGTLYGRYRDVYGCINRPYRTARDFWQAKGPAEVLERLQRGELSLDAGASALGVSTSNLAAYMADLEPQDRGFEPIPIEIDPSLTLKSYTNLVKTMRKTIATPPEKPKKILINSVTDEDPIPATVITTSDGKKTTTTTANVSGTAGKWPSIRVASLEALRGDAPGAPAPAAGAPAPASPSPSLLMRTRPDLTIVAAKKPDKKDET